MVTAHKLRSEAPLVHRDQRVKGPITQKVRDVFVSFQSWLRISVARKPFTLAKIRVVAQANLRIATDAQIKARLGITRSVAKSVLEQALRKAEKGKEGTDRERLTVDYFGSAFIWNAAFTDADVADDLAYVLGKIGILQPADRARFAAIEPFLTLYVVALMHGSAIVLEDGSRAELVGGFDNDEGRIEVKARLEASEFGKAIFAPVCIYWTTLHGTNHCSQALLESPGRWQGPIEIDDAGKLAPLD